MEVEIGHGAYILYVERDTDKELFFKFAEELRYELNIEYTLEYDAPYDECFYEFTYLGYSLMLNYDPYLGTSIVNFGEKPELKPIEALKDRILKFWPNSQT